MNQFSKLVLLQGNIVKQINLLPWRDHEKKLKKRQFFIIWLGVSCLCFILLFMANAMINEQIKNYEMVSHRTSINLKASSYKMQEIKKLQYEKKELTKIIKNTQINHHQLRKILDFMIHLKYLITPDIFISLVEYYPPYFIVNMHTSSEKKYLKIIKIMKIKYNFKLKTLIFNKSKDDLALDFLIKIRV